MRLSVVIVKDRQLTYFQSLLTAYTCKRVQRTKYVEAAHTIHSLSHSASSLKRIAKLRRNERLLADRVSIENKVLSVSGGHVICGDVTSVRIVGQSLMMCRLFLLTVDEVRTILRGRVLVEFHVMTTGASIKPADNVTYHLNYYCNDPEQHMLVRYGVVTVC